MIPKNITIEHVLKALERIDQKGIEWPLTKSKKYDLIYNDKTYPPKLTISLANEFANDKYLSHTEFNTYEAQNYLKKLSSDFVIVEKEGINPILEMISNYKKLILKNSFNDEIYKWKLIEKYMGRPDLNASDFYQEIKSIDYSNLMYYNAIGVLKDIAKDKPEELRNCFKTLFDETIPLDERMLFFSSKTKELFKLIKGNDKLSHHQDERSMACYLTYYNPEKYTFYKTSFYKKYCDLTDIKPQKSGERFIHYLQLIDELINEYIVDDEELLKLYKESISGDLFQDSNYRLLAQDILYRSLEYKSDISNYWIFQGNPDKFDFETAIKEELLKDWTITAHKEEVDIGDAVIIWITGKNSGCYALAKVTSLPFKKEVSADDALWKEENKNEWKVNIEITHNLLHTPILWRNIKDNEVFNNFKAGNQGTNFAATKEEFDAILKLAENMNKKKFWLYAPGENAEMWDEFYEKGIMALGWDNLGDLNNYNTKEEIVTKLQEIEDTTSSKKNDATANYEFKNLLSFGDIIFVKKGRSELLGLGEVTSDYYFDQNRIHFQSCRKVKWIKKGNWKTDHSLAIKTLTDITKYPSEHPDYEFYYERLIDTMNNNKKLNMNHPLNQILYGPPGTGKTYHTINKAISIIENKDDIELKNESRTELKKRFEDYVLKGQIVFTTFHQSMSYEDFIEGIKPETLDGVVTYEIQDGIFKLLCSKANSSKQSNFEAAYKSLLEEISEINEGILELKTPTGKSYWVSINSKNNLTLRTGTEKKQQGTLIKTAIENEANGIKNFYGWEGYASGLINHLKTKHQLIIGEKVNNNYVLIIDEINRGNVSQIFGELITLIEEDKRLGKDEALEVTLPYSKEKFGVPSNLYIIGTMNTADRSVEALDTALRRRFSFEEMLPKYDLTELNKKVAEILLSDLLSVINKRIEKLLDKDHQIGHSYLMSVNDINDLKLIFYNKIIPLLQEYFFGDYGKIGLVLGNGFINKKEWNISIDSFADFTYESANEFDEKDVYEIIDYRKPVINYSIKIKDKTIEMNFENAIKLLMKQSIE